MFKIRLVEMLTGEFYIEVIIQRKYRLQIQILEPLADRSVKLDIA